MQTLFKIWLFTILATAHSAAEPSHPSANLREELTRVANPAAWPQTLACVIHLYAATADLPDTDPTRVGPMVITACAEATLKARAALLVALAWGESRFDQRAQPLCGVLQVNPIDINQPIGVCATWRTDLQLAVHAGVIEIEMLMADHRVAGDMRKMLLYRACGNKAFNGTCDAKKYAWVEAALARYLQLERAMTKRAAS